jgi:hypothetical protein
VRIHQLRADLAGAVLRHVGYDPRVNI